MPTDNVPVTQGDRQRAWPIWLWLFGDAADETNFMEGDDDEHHVVQAFARHRIATIEACARVAEEAPEQILHFWSRPGGPPGNGYRPTTKADIAAALRNLKDSPHLENGE